MPVYFLKENSFERGREAIVNKMLSYIIKDYIESR